MGMDYVGRRPKNKKGESLHLNWSGHSWLLPLLDQLGCDLSEWSGVNDGDRISARTCRAWAKAIRDALAADRIVEATYHDKRYMGGERTIPVVRETKDVPMAELLPPHETSGQAAAVFAIHEQFLGWKPDENFHRLQPLDAETKKWVEDMADFFANCGGCRQW